MILLCRERPPVERKADGQASSGSLLRFPAGPRTASARTVLTYVVKERTILSGLTSTTTQPLGWPVE